MRDLDPDERAFLRTLSPAERKRSNPQNVAGNYHRRDHQDPDVQNLADLLRALRQALPSWRLEAPDALTTRKVDPYTTPILERRVGRGASSESLGSVIARRKIAEREVAARARATRREAECRARYQSQIGRLAHHCKGHSLNDLRASIRIFLGVDKVPGPLPKIVQAERSRQESMRLERSARRTQQPMDPMSLRWPTLKVKLIHDQVWSVLMAYYHTTHSSFEDAAHTLKIVFGEPAAEGKTQHGGCHNYGGHWRRAYVNWTTTLTVTPNWLSQVRRLGTCVVENQLVLGVVGELRAVSGEAVEAVVLVQGRGAHVAGKSVALYREQGGIWRIEGRPVRTRWERLLEEPASLVPRRRRSWAGER